MKIDYQFKSRVLKSGLVDYIPKIVKYESFQSGFSNYSSKDVLSYEEYSFLLNSFKSTFSEEEITEAKKIYKANLNRKTRLRKVLSLMFQKPCIFLTLNFNDKALKMKPYVRRKKISDFLNSFNVPYVANIDFGSDSQYIDRRGELRQATSREHYHAVLMLPFIDLSLYKYGFAFAEPVRISNTSNKKISSYLSKLVNHAIKESTKQTRLMYSKLCKTLKPIRQPLVEVDIDFPTKQIDIDDILFSSS